MKRYPNCGFLSMKKDFAELTVGEYYLMEQERLKVFHVSGICAACAPNLSRCFGSHALFLFCSQRKVCHKKMACFRDFIDYTLGNIKSQMNSVYRLSQ